MKLPLRLCSFSLVILLCACATPASAAGMLWSTFLGGGGADNGYALATDGSGNTIITGSTTSTNYPTTSGAAQRSNGGATDVVVTKLATDGTTVLWSTYLGGAGDDIARGVAVGPGGDVFVVGSTGSSAFPVTAGAWRTAFGGGAADGFVARLSASTGALVYATFVGASWDDYPRGVAVDANNCAFVAGFTNSVDFPTTAGVVKTTRSPGLYDGADGFVTKLNASGSGAVYSTLIGTNSATDEVMAIALDPSGLATVTGWTTSGGFPTTANAFDRTLSNGHEAFVSRLNAAANGYVFSTFLGGAGLDEGYGIAVDAAGATYVTGLTTSADFPTTAGAPQCALGAVGYYDAFATKLSATGSALGWSTYIGGSADERGWAISVTSAGLAAVVGNATSSNFPTTSGAYRTTLAGGADAFCTVINATGTGWKYSTYLGSTGTDCANGVAYQPNGHVVTVGATDNSGFPTTAQAYDPAQNSAGVNDIFVSSLDVGAVGSTAVGDGGEPGVASLRVGPNPFRSMAAIRFSLAQSGELTVNVLDLQGRVVRHLAAGATGAGTHEIAWDGRDDRGNDAGTGVFFVQAANEGRRVSAARIVRLR
jgi:hypothetical protein